ncbi:MAG: ATP-binding cassette domain-containing protein [Dehalococcoidia bacterium]|nr:ATP-binding cassette domain-containing protein [Dehalococcoidia bacterium]
MAGVGDSRFDSDVAGAPALEARRLRKQFGGRDVVNDVSFHVKSGEVVGLVGPNGAGKTTTIRMMLGILAPDEGEARALGGPLTEETQERIGYLPEERGLYEGLRLTVVLSYLGQLKGLSRRHAAIRTGEMLDAVGMSEHAHKKVRELSRGMTQLVQFGATLLHRPDILVLDEPFSGLDPVNARRMKELVLEEKERGAAIIFSTHQMTDVEELSDRVLMIDGGEVALDGAPSELRRRYRGDTIRVESPDAPPASISGVGEVVRSAESISMRLTDRATAEQVLKQLLDAGMRIERFEVALPTLEEIFIREVQGRRGTR